MGFFPSTIAAALAGDVVQVSLLGFFDFASQPMRLWQGHGTLNAGGQQWAGIGQFGAVSEIEQAIGGTAPQVTFTLSGVDSASIANALDNSEDVKGRDCTVYLQFFDAEFAPLDNTYAIWAGTMDQMRVRATPGSRTIELTAETLFARRGMPAFGYLTDRDQQRLFPGDRGLEQVPAMIRKVTKWPNSG